MFIINGEYIKIYEERLFIYNDNVYDPVFWI